VNVTYIKPAEPKPKKSIPIKPVEETIKDDFDFEDVIEAKEKIIKPPVQIENKECKPL